MKAEILLSRMETEDNADPGEMTATKLTENYCTTPLHFLELFLNSHHTIARTFCHLELLRRSHHTIVPENTSRAEF